MTMPKQARLQAIISTAMPVPPTNASKQYLREASKQGVQFDGHPLYSKVRKIIHKRECSAIRIVVYYPLLILSTNSSGVSISILEKPNHFLPKSLMDAPM